MKQFHVAILLLDEVGGQVRYNKAYGILIDVMRDLVNEGGSAHISETFGVKYLKQAKTTHIAAQSIYAIINDATEDAVKEAIKIFLNKASIPEVLVDLTYTSVGKIEL